MKLLNYFVVLLSLALISVLTSWNNPVSFANTKIHRFFLIKSTTIVSAFFRLPGHYRSNQEYNNWIGHMLSEVNDNLVVFTSPAEVDLLRSLRGNRPMIVHVYNSIYDWPWASQYKEEFQRQHLIDDQSLIRKNPDVYAIWNSKPSFMAYAAERNDFNSEYFFWVDMGSRREHGFFFSNWPNEDRVSKVFKNNEQRLLFCLILPMNFTWDWRTKGSQYPNVGLQGTFFAGKRDAIIRFNDTYTKYFNLFISLKSFVGSDQGVFSGIISDDSLKSGFMTLDVRERACGVDNWFYFYHFFKNSNDGLTHCENDNNWPAAKIIKWDK